MEEQRVWWGREEKGGAERVWWGREENGGAESMVG